VLEHIQLDLFCFASMLGGPDRRTLFMLVADWRGPENVEDVVEARTGQILVADAPAPGVAGRERSGVRRAFARSRRTSRHNADSGARGRGASCAPTS
jgi:hypothetical protein